MSIPAAEGGSARLMASLVLTVASVAFAAYALLLLVGVTLVGWVIDALRPTGAHLEPWPLLWRAALVLIVGWGVGLGGAWLADQPDVASRRSLGAVAGLVGVLAGAVVMWFTGLI